MKPAQTTKILIIGIGNPYRHDDAVGLTIAARLRESRLRSQASTAFTVIEHSGEGASLIDVWKGASTVIIIDAVCSGAAVGTIHRFEASEQKIPVDFFNYSTHAFSLAEAIEMARVLNQLPERVIVYGIEGEDFTLGVGLSAAVEKTAPEIAIMVLAEIRKANSATSG